MDKDEEAENFFFCQAPADQKEGIVGTVRVIGWNCATNGKTERGGGLGQWRRGSKELEADGRREKPSRAEEDWASEGAKRALVSRPGSRDAEQTSKVRMRVRENLERDDFQHNEALEELETDGDDESARA